MEYKERQVLFNEIVNNEFTHISAFKEVNDNKENKEMIAAKNESLEISEKLLENLSEEASELFDNYSSADTTYWIEVARYYFKKGVEAGIKNLNFTKNLI